MRWRWLLFFLMIIGVGGWYGAHHIPSLAQWVEEKTLSQEISTLEIRFTTEDILKTCQKELLKSPAHILLDTQLRYVPYLWMEVKYATDDASTEEGIALWGLNDGELVIDALTWEKTHGYEDCLLAKVDATDFFVLNAVAAQGGCMQLSSLQQSTPLEGALLERAIASCEKKKLLFIKGDTLRLHFDKPKFATFPITTIQEDFVAPADKSIQKEPKRYSTTQITGLAQKAFGNAFTIRRTKEVFVPIYTISVQNPDGSILSTQWNALNGQRIKR